MSGQEVGSTKGAHLNAQARRVVAGVDADGKSTIVLDENTATRAAAEAFTVCDVWRVERLPVHVDQEDTLDGTVALSPPPEGLVVRVTTFPPDSEWDPASAYGESLEALQGADAEVADDSIPGLHATDTVDVVTVLSGELYAVLERKETLLRPGDTFVQRGTKHTWSNRGDVPATVVAIMMAAER